MSKPTAHEAVSGTVKRLVDRARAAAYRLVCAHDPEAVHDFRVALRRLRTVVRGSRPLYGKKALKPFEAELKRFGDATSALRDAEVLGETLALADLDAPTARAAERWLSERRSHEDALRQRAVTLVKGPELEARFEALLDLMARAPKRDASLAPFASARISDAQLGVTELLPVDPADVARLHRLRIRFKRLRYVAEMLVELGQRQGKHDKALPGRLELLMRESARMQKVLGQLHDVDQALATLGDSSLELVEQGPLRAALLGLRERLVEKVIAALNALSAAVVPTRHRVADDWHQLR